MSKKIFFLLSLSIILIVFFIVFIFSFDALSYKVFLPRYRGDYVSNPYYELLLGIITFFILLILVFLFFKDKRLVIIWFIKGFVVTLFFMMFYEYHYGLDAYVYAAHAIENNIPVSFGKAGTYNVMYINHFFTYIVGKSYYSLKVFNSFIGFLGLLFIYKTYEYIMQKLNLKINEKFIYFFFLFPSVVFWSSILGKDPLNLFFIGMFSYAFIHFIDEFRIKYLIMILLSVWLVSYIRPWWSLIMIIAIFLYYAKANSFKNILLLSIVLPIMVVLLVGFLQSKGIYSIQDLFMKMNSTIQNLAYGGSSVGVAKINNFFDYIVWFIPNLFTALFRPMPWDIRNAFTALAAMENLLLLYLTYKYIIKNWKEIYSIKYLKFYILLIFSWALFYVIISPTNLGMAARFKLQVLPIILVLIGVSYEIQKQKNSNNP